jgi:DNA-binding beta-propeller fold protein YncE
MSSAQSRTTPAVLALASFLALAACSGDPASPTSPATTSRPSEGSSAASPSALPSASEPAGDSIDERADATLENVTGEPDWPLGGFGSVWAVAPDQEEPAMLRIDPATNEIVASIPLPGQRCQGLTVSDDAVWACATTGAVRIDPETNAITGEVAFETGQVWGRLAFGSGSVWAIGVDDSVPNQLVRIDPAAMTASAIPLGHGAVSLAYGFDAVWVTASQDGLVLRIDPDSQEVTEHTSGLDRPMTIVAGPDSLWLTLFGSEDLAPGEPTVVRIDPSDGSAVTEIATGVASLGKGGLWATDDAVWVRAPDQFLTRIDPATNEVVETITGPPGTGDVTVAFGSVWITAGNALSVYRLEP